MAATRRPIKRGPGKRMVDGKSFRLADEVRYIQRRAADHDGRVITIGQLILFSTETGDAWLLDPTDRLAARLARDGDPEPIHIEETDTTFAIDWKGHYRIEGPAFVYVDRDTGRTSAILGYPTQKLQNLALERFPLDVNQNSYRGFPPARKSDFGFLRRQRRGCRMAKGYSKDLRVRAVSIVEAGESAREAARVLGLGASTAIRWMERWTTTGSVDAKPGTGHCRSPLEQHKQWLLDLMAAQPDLTLDEVRVRLRAEKKLKSSKSSIARFYERHDITVKKKLCTPPSRIVLTSRPRARS